MKFTYRSIAAGALAMATGFAGIALSSWALADTLGTQTITNANHYGYFGFASTSQFNTKAVVGPFSGTARVIRVQGSITQVHPDAWVSSIRVQPSGAALAGYQPWFQFSNQRDFTGTVPVSATIYAPGGFDLSKPLNFEMFSIDAEQFVPGLDARSTLTYTFDSALPPGTAEYTGTLAVGDPTFNRPIQFPSSGPTGWSEPFLSGHMPFYDAQPFHVASAGKYDLVTANEFESAGVLYANSFNPASPLTNVLWAFSQTGNVLRNRSFNDLPFNDDATGGTLITADLVPGVQYYFVTSAYAAPSEPVDGGPFVGRYSNLITGPGAVTLGLVPEPGIGLIGSFALVLLTRRRRRRRRRRA
jgi:hypothetical protein